MDKNCAVLHKDKDGKTIPCPDQANSIETSIPASATAGAVNSALGDAVSTGKRIGIVPECCGSLLPELTKCLRVISDGINVIGDHFDAIKEFLIFIADNIGLGHENSLVVGLDSAKSSNTPTIEGDADKAGSPSVVAGEPAPPSDAESPEPPCGDVSPSGRICARDENHHGSHHDKTGETGWDYHQTPAAQLSNLALVTWFASEAGRQATADEHERDYTRMVELDTELMRRLEVSGAPAPDAHDPENTANRERETGDDGGATQTATPPSASDDFHDKFCLNDDVHALGCTQLGFGVIPTGIGNFATNAPDDDDYQFRVVAP